MSAAWRLSELGHRVTVLERDDAVGGMARTITMGKYLVDFGPHTFHIRETAESRAVVESVRKFFGDDPLILTRGTRVLLHGKEYIYPLEIFQVLKGVNPAAGAANRLRLPRRDRHVGVLSGAQGGLVRRLGRAESRTHALRPLLRHLLRPRVGAADRPDLVEAGAASRQAQPRERRSCDRWAFAPIRPRTSRSTCIRAAGISLLYEGMADVVRQAGNRILLNSTVVRLEREGNRIARVVYRA